MNNLKNNIDHKSTLCNAKDSIVCFIDIQTRLVESMPVKVKSRLISNSLQLVEAAVGYNIPIVATEQSSQILGGFLPEIIEGLPSDTFYLDKSTFSCCGDDDFLNFLKESGKKQIILCGVEVHISILQTAIELMQLGYDVFLVEDNVGARRLDNFTNGIKRLAHSGVTISNLESILSEWSRS